MDINVGLNYLAGRIAQLEKEKALLLIQNQAKPTPPVPVPDQRDATEKAQDAIRDAVR